MTDQTPLTAACEFVPPHEPWTCRIHHGIRTSLNEPQCDATRQPASPDLRARMLRLCHAVIGRQPYDIHREEAIALRDDLYADKAAASLSGYALPELTALFMALTGFHDGDAPTSDVIDAADNLRDRVERLIPDDLRGRMS